MFDSIGRLIESLGDLIPRIRQVYPFERALRFTRGKHYSILEPGLYWYWPVIQSIEKLTVVPTAIDIPIQVVSTGDGTSYAVALSVVYTIDDPESFYLSNHDTLDTMSELIQKNTCEVIAGHMQLPISFQGLKDLSHKILAPANEDLQSYGIVVKSLAINNLARTKVLHVNSSGPLVHIANNEE